MHEVELKGIVADPVGLRARLLAAGAHEVFHGSLSDCRYDLPSRSLAERDHVLRLRVYRDESGERAVLDWKGPTEYSTGYKVREELSTSCGDGETLALMLERLGYVVTYEIDRDIEQFELAGTVLRIERYPRMDVLLEVEGTPEAIERAIAQAGVPRADFTSDRLADFILRFEARTGERAAVSARERSGDYLFNVTGG